MNSIFRKFETIETINSYNTINCTTDTPIKCINVYQIVSTFKKQINNELVKF